MIVWAHSYYDDGSVFFDDTLYTEAFCDTVTSAYDTCVYAVRSSYGVWEIDPDSGWEPRKFSLERVP